MRVACEGGAAAWVVGTPAAPVFRDMACLSQRVMALLEFVCLVGCFFFFFFEPLVAGDQKTSLASLSP